MIPFNFHHLYYFYVVASEQSFTRAAKILRVSQPALSGQLKQFQNYWDLQLFRRQGNKIILTEQGNLIFTYAKAIFDLGQELNDSIVNRRIGGEQKLKLGVSVSVPGAIVRALLEYVYSVHPGAQLVLKQDRIENMVDSLVTHRLDLLVNDFAYECDIQEGIQNYLVAASPMVFCASRSLASRYKRIPEDLDGAPLILPTAPDRTYHALQNYFHMHKLKPEIVAEVQDLEQVRLLVTMGKGIGFLNSYALNHSPERKTLVVLKDRSKHGIIDTIYLIKRERKMPHPLVDQIIENFKLKE